jgi:hypothetical protein
MSQPNILGLVPGIVFHDSPVGVYKIDLAPVATVILYLPSHRKLLLVRFAWRVQSVVDTRAKKSSQESSRQYKPTRSKVHRKKTQAKLPETTTPPAG